MKIHIRIGIAVFIALYFVTGCSPANDPVKVAEGEAIRLQAEAEAADAAQVRDIARENQNWNNQVREEKAQTWAYVENTAHSLAKILVWCVFFGLGSFILAASWSVSYGAVKTAQAYGTLVQIRAQILPPDRRTGLRPQLLFEDVKMLPADTWLGRLGIQHVRESKYWVNDTMTGASGMIDVDKPANTTQLEIYRQAVLQAQILQAQKGTQMFSSKGGVAEQMALIDAHLPDAGMVLLEKSIEAFQDKE